MDKIDQELIVELQKNGRQSYVKLAQAVGVAEATVKNRVKGLVDKGYIDITAVAHLDKLGYDFVGIMGLQVELSELKRVGYELARLPNVCYVSHVTGRYDLILIIVTKSSRMFAEFVEDVMSTFPSILRIETFVALNTYKGGVFIPDTSQIISGLDGV